MEIIFNVENEIKQEYLSSKPTATAESDSFVLRLIDEYEELIGKSVYNFSVSELDELFSTFKNSSRKTGDKNKSILVTYIKYCISKNLVTHQQNRAEFINVKKHVSKQALLNKFITKQKMLQYQNILFNPQDQLMIWLPYIGVLGRTIEEGTKEEILNLSIDDIYPLKNKIVLRQNDGETRELDGIEDFIFDLIKETYEQKLYVENNNEMTNNKRLNGIPRQTPINKTGEYGGYNSRYIFRIPGKNKFERFTPSILNSRMNRIKKYVGNPYLNYTSLYISGMLQMCFDIYNEKGEITNRDFDDVCVRFNYGIPEEIEDSTKKQSAYWHVLKSMFNQYKDLLL